MPLLLCPNDNSSMQTVHRSGVEFEMCPTCRGVWLDRGELEKMMEQAMYSRPIDPPPPPQPPGYPPQPGYAPQYQQRPPEPRYDDRYRDSRHHRWDDDDYRKKKRKGLDIFDIFD